MTEEQTLFESKFATQKTQEKAEEYKFEPIQGYPMLHWKGKRPYRSTQYYPAQLKETHGDPVDGWYNRIYWGDNLQVMSHMLREFRGKVQLVYIDPPFDSKADYKKSISLKGKKLTNDHSAFEEKQYTDIWTNDDYLQFMYERLILLRELLSANGSIFLHCDYRKSHQLRCMLEEIFGHNNLRNEIIWRRANAHNDPGKFGIITDTIFYFNRNNDRIWNQQFRPVSEEYIQSHFKKKDQDGRCYRLVPLDAPKHGDGGNLVYEWKGKMPPASRTWAYIKDRMIDMEKKGIIAYTSTGNPCLKRYLDEMPGQPVQNLWDDLPLVNPMAKERENYPTQKPETLLERIIKTSSNPGDLVFDCFMGSGTTQAVAMKLGRRFIGADINLGAIQITTKRLLSVANEIKQQNAQTTIDIEENTPKTFYTGFSVYNVNHYDVFCNPIQAKDLLMEALAIESLPRTIYDGQKDGRMVKIMPANRIATRSDLNELISNFDYKLFEKRQAENPKKPVEKITLICMGHEPDLGAHLEKESGFKLDVQVVDILRDKSHLEFKRDSEANVVIKDNSLLIESFYPMNLLQKLSMFKENVEDWREMVESIMIDWNYDGEVFKPDTTDIPQKNEMVKGIYPIPKRTSNIRVKITDLLSESWEGEVKSNG